MFIKGTVITPPIDGQDMPNMEEVSPIDTHPRVDALHVRIEKGPVIIVNNATGHEMKPGDEVEMIVTQDPDQGGNVYQITRKISLAAVEA